MFLAVSTTSARIIGAWLWSSSSPPRGQQRRLVGRPWRRAWPITLGCARPCFWATSSTPRATSAKRVLQVRDDEADQAGLSFFQAQAVGDAAGPVVEGLDDALYVLARLGMDQLRFVEHAGDG